MFLFRKAIPNSSEGNSGNTIPNCFDALNRITRFQDTSGTAPVDIAYVYDAVGNVRHMHAEYRQIGQEGDIGTTSVPQDYWYRYDTMNRFVTTKGELSGTAGLSTTQIVHGDYGGMDITYDLAGQRRSMFKVTLATAQVYEDGIGPPGGGPGEPGDPGGGHTPPGGGGGMITIQYAQEYREDYQYGADGQLDTVTSATGSLEFNLHTRSWEATHLSGPSTAVAARYTRDALGRVTLYQEYAGASVGYAKSTSYNLKSQATDEVTTTLRGGVTYVASTHYDYALEAVYNSGVWGGGAYLGGVVTHTVTTNSQNGVAKPTSVTENEYGWWDSAVQTLSQVDTDTSTGADGLQESHYHYDAAGHLQWVDIADGRPRNVYLVNDNDGRVLGRDEEDFTSGGSPAAGGDPRELHYYFMGQRIGDISNNGTSNTDYVASLAEHTATPGSGPFRGGSAWNNALRTADFDQSYDAINGLSYDGVAGSYVAAQGDTLMSVAQQVWGDASLWYLIADANGLSGDTTLVAGQVLSLPNKVHNAHNSAGTWRPYDPNQALGDTSPTAPRPAAQQNCGTMGVVLMLVVAAVVATVVTAGAASAATGASFGHALGAVLGGNLAGLSAAGATAGTGGLAAAGAAAGAIASGGALGAAGAIGAGVLGAVAGSLASQGLGIAMGMQARIDWKGVAVAGISAGVTAGVGALGKAMAAGKFGTAAETIGKVLDHGWGGTALRGALSEAATQGIAAATRLRPGFEFAAVAQMGVGAGLGGALGLRGPVGGTASGMAGAVAGVAALSLAQGSDFGDTLRAALPSIIGQSVGNLLIGAASGQEGAEAQDERVAGLEAAGGALGSGASGVRRGAELATQGSELQRLGVADPETDLSDVPARGYSLSSSDGLQAEGADSNDIVVIGSRRHSLRTSQASGPTTYRLNFLAEAPKVPTETYAPPPIRLTQRSSALSFSDLGRRLGVAALRRVVPGFSIGYALFGADEIGSEVETPIAGSDFTIGGRADDTARDIVSADGRKLGGLRPTGYTNLYQITQNGEKGQFNTSLPYVGGSNIVYIDQVDGYNVGFAVRAESDADWAIIDEGRAQGWDSTRIQSAINSRKFLDNTADVINSIIQTKKGSRPDPTTYLPQPYIDEHLSLFRGGVAKFVYSIHPSGVVGPPSGTYVLPASIADELETRAGGNIGILEESLGLERGTLGPNPLRVDIPNPSNLRMPSGNELGANLQWRPGGYTSAGLPEATIDSPQPGTYHVRRVR